MAHTIILVGYGAFVEVEHHDIFCDLYRCYDSETHAFYGKVITNDRQTAIDYFKDRIEEISRQGKTC